MKKMIYQAERKIEVLDTGTCLRFFYWILNLGTHPTAYVKISESHKYYQKHYDDIDIDVHGGLTYSKDHLWISESQEIEGWFIGWDYAHYNDYAGYEEKLPEELRLKSSGKKWTTKEIREEVYKVCEQLRECE